MQDTKSESGTNTVKLCFLILCCITEDQYANSLMHDVGLAFKVRLHKLPMRHRKLGVDQTTSSQPLISSLLGEFVVAGVLRYIAFIAPGGEILALQVGLCGFKYWERF